MSEKTLHCVVDAGVGIKLFVEDPLSDKAQRLFACLAADPPAELYVPDLFYIECANLLWKYVRFGGMPPATARANLADLAKLALHSAPMASLMSTALELAIKHGISAYDASYVALAEHLGAELVTADAKLAKAVDRARWLGDWEPAL